MNTLTRPSVFIGSSVEGLDVLEALVVNLEHDCEVVPWTAMFDPSEYTLESLESHLDRFDFAILVLSGDDIIEQRKEKGKVPRGNILIELGMFFGKLGRKRTIMVADRSAAILLPTDLDGLTLATYIPHRNGNCRSALVPACVKIKQVMRNQGPRVPVLG